MKGMPFDNCWVRKRIESDRDFEFEQVEGGTGEDLPRSGFDYWVGGWKHYKAYLQMTDRMRNRILEWLVETEHPYVETIREQAFKSPDA